jgi:hypothetical protein
MVGVNARLNRHEIHRYARAVYFGFGENMKSKKKMVTSFFPSVTLFHSSRGQRTLLGTEEVLVHDMDRESAWVSIKDGLPIVMTVPLGDLRVEENEA